MTSPYDRRADETRQLKPMQILYGTVVTAALHRIGRPTRRSSPLENRKRRRRAVQQAGPPETIQSISRRRSCAGWNRPSPEGCTGARNRINLQTIRLTCLSVPISSILVPFHIPHRPTCSALCLQSGLGVALSRGPPAAPP